MNLDITAFIRELLFGHDCVVIPGFGGFIGNYNPARIEKGTGTFYPPVRKISFNRNLDHNDGLLMKKISSVAGMSYGEAGIIVGEFVADICTKLERGEKVVFDKIGTFSTNQEGNIQFEPDSEVNYYSDSYGLESFRYLPIEGYDIRKRITGEIHDRSEVRHSLRKYMWRAAVIIPLAGALIAVSVKTDLFKGSIEKSALNPLASAEFEQNKAVVDEENAAAQPIISIEAGTATADSFNIKDETTAPILTATQPVAAVPEPVTKPVEPAVNKITNEAGYYIVTGSFQSEENAMVQVNQLKAAGYNPEVTSSGKGFYRVSAMLCPDMATALKEKDSVAAKFPGAWVARKK
jgi:nucleoid DNA-binding protein/cell division septation protein DedD